MLRGRLELPLGGQRISISGGPFDAMPDGARGLCLEARAARVAEAEWQLDVPDFGLPDEAGLRAVLADMLEAMRAAPDGAQRSALYAEAEAELTLANVFIPFGQPVRWSLVRGDVSGFATNRWGVHPLMPIATRPR